MIISENKEVISSQNYDILQIKSKLKSLNNHISNLLQKKIHIDLEIKKTKKSLAKLRKSSTFLMKNSLKLEDTDVPIQGIAQLELLLEGTGIDIKDFVEIDQLLDLSLALEEEITAMESFLYTPGI